MTTPPMRQPERRKRWQRWADALGGGLFVALFLVFVVQIAARFVFNQPLPWTDELAVVLYLWVILWACAAMVPEQEHVAFDLLWQRASPRTQAAMQLLGHALLGTLAACSLPATWDYVIFMAREGTPVLGLPLAWVFFPYGLLVSVLVLRSAHGVWQAGRALRAPSETRP